MKKLLSILAFFLVLSCSSDDNVISTCNEQVVSSYQQDQQLVSNVKNNVIAIEFDYGIFDAVISERLKGLSLFDLPLNSEGKITAIYPDMFSTYPTKVVFGYFKEGNLSCEKLNEYISQVQNISEVHNVRKVIEGSNKYSIMKETNIIVVKLESESELSNLQSQADKYGYILSESDPMKMNDNQELIYYLIDETAKKSIIEMAKVLSQAIKYEYISPQFVNIG
ncbi:hypothetical protein [Paenimyroides baculatum]|uniref:Lipoprotein n=1 Tax=Paenimyroides baculatum TaxID=2608000 RepID=A0A5M6CL75_9FLAO|nr:hypothetical protein [Paenimyroides baculatum]KAA5535951.1 hypothetical protein F0460_05810 [Paenimyroides baculatum]